VPQLLGLPVPGASDLVTIRTQTAPLRVLIADDHPTYADALRVLLSRDDRIEVVGAAGNGQQAVEMEAELEPDLVLMDLEMPVMNGLEATRILAERGGAPVILLTGSNSADVDSALSAGALSYLPKGLDSSTLLEHLLAVSTTRPRS
jgi:two-component system, NarL family, nitrate/nitrite response regulator NarL